MSDSYQTFEEAANEKAYECKCYVVQQTRAQSNFPFMPGSLAQCQQQQLFKETWE